MYRKLIENYIDKISKNDIYNFGYKNGISLSFEEVNLLYHYLMNYKEDLLNKNIDFIFLDMEEKIGHEKSLTIKKLYNSYFDKYQDFL